MWTTYKNYTRKVKSNGLSLTAISTPIISRAPHQGFTGPTVSKAGRENQKQT
jgi:hypothetical protein